MKKPLFFTILVLGLVIVVSCHHSNLHQEGINHIEATELREMLNSGEKPLLLDVRTTVEFNGALGHLDRAVLIPVQELENRAAELNPDKDRLIVIYCRSGNRSQVAAKILMKQNFQVLNMVGGMKAWNKLN